MKKIISVILSAMLCSALAFSSLAVEEKSTQAAAQSTTAQAAVQPTTKPLVPADDLTAQNAFSWFEKIIVLESEGKKAEAGEAMFSLYSLLKENGVTDHLTLCSQMKKYAEDHSSDLIPVFSDMTSVDKVVRFFTLEGEFDRIAVQKAIEASWSLASLISLYTGAYIVSPTVAQKVEPGKTTMVENPKTGDSSVKTTAAFAALGLGVAVIAFCAKKKEN